MNIFHVAGAKHFCQNFGTSGSSTGSLKDYLARLNKTITQLREGSQEFNEYRNCSLCDSERSLFLAASHYRRALDLMTIGSAAWAHVTLYYGSFLAAHSIITMFGGWIDPPLWVEVSAANPGQQELHIHRKPPSGKKGGGTHKGFWDLYYIACKPLTVSVDRTLLFAVDPVSSNPYWQIEARNEINYDTYRAFELSYGFKSGFDEMRFPSCLPGKLNTQYQVTEAMILQAFSFAKTFGLATDAMNLLMPTTPRCDVVKKLVYEVVSPNLEAKTRKAELLS